MFLCQRRLLKRTHEPQGKFKTHLRSLQAVGTTLYGPRQPKKPAAPVLVNPCKDILPQQILLFPQQIFSLITTEKKYCIVYMLTCLKGTFFSSARASTNTVECLYVSLKCWYSFLGAIHGPPSAQSELPPSLNCLQTPRMAWLIYKGEQCPSQQYPYRLLSIRMSLAWVWQ